MAADTATFRATRPEVGLTPARFMTIRPAAGLLFVVSLTVGSAAMSHAQSLTAKAPAALGSAALGSAALAPSYPDAGDPAALGRWFGQTTHLPAKSILAITDNAIFAAFPKHTSGPFWTVDVRLESITPQSTAKLGGRSIRLRLNVRCDTKTVRLNFLDVYPGSDLTGAPIHRAPQNPWAQPKPDSYVADAVRLACDKTFKGPFAAVAAAAPQQGVDPQPTATAQAAAPSPEREAVLRTPHALVLGSAVQIGAYGTVAAAKGAWNAVRVAQPDMTSGLSNATQPTQVGGRTLYRSIVQGFRTSAAAVSFCETLRASGQPCLAFGSAKP